LEIQSVREKNIGDYAYINEAYTMYGGEI